MSVLTRDKLINSKFETITNDPILCDHVGCRHLPCRELRCLSTDTWYTLLNSSPRLGSAPAASNSLTALKIPTQTHVFGYFPIGFIYTKTSYSTKLSDPLLLLYIHNKSMGRKKIKINNWNISLKATMYYTLYLTLRLQQKRRDFTLNK